MDSTYPNRHYQWGAQDGGTKGNQLPPQTPQRTGFTWETIFDRAKARRLTARYYYSDLPFAALYGSAASPGRTRSRSSTTTPRPASSPTSPSSTPRSSARTRGPPATSIRTATSASARRSCPTSSTPSCESPQYRRGVLFIDYDEWGGFFEHVEPRFVPDARAEPPDIDKTTG